MGAILTISQYETLYWYHLLRNQSHPLTVPEYGGLSMYGGAGERSFVDTINNILYWAIYSITSPCLFTTCRLLVSTKPTQFWFAQIWQMTLQLHLFRTICFFFIAIHFILSHWSSHRETRFERSSLFTRRSQVHTSLHFHLTPIIMINSAIISLDISKLLNKDIYVEKSL